jgi:RHS repeat-associated protein
VHNLAFSTSNNRITTAGFSYDANGNLTNDTVHAYTFNAENQIKTVAAVNAYTYDGEGQRVRKFVGENTRFVYGIGGQLIAEFDGSTGNLKKEYLYGGATLITIEPAAVNSNGTQYTTSDNLGSARAITNASGSVVSRHDYMPFGEELCAGTGGRTAGMGFCAGGDTNRKKFTGYERDAETGLDFAQARYFSSTEGRFTSADSLLGSLVNPQSLNRYAYVLNNPLNSTDPSGHLPVSATGSITGGWGGFEGPEAGDLPEQYEEEITRIKAVIAENRNNAAGALGNEAALSGSNESAAEHVDDEEGHSGEQQNPAQTDHDPKANFDSPEAYKKEVLDTYLTKINECVPIIFGTKAKKIGTLTAENAPALNITLNSKGVGKMSNVAKALGSNNPDKGRYGTVYIASNYFDYIAPLPLRTQWRGALLGAFFHEWANILSAKVAGGREDKFGDPAGVGRGKDTDTGANFQRCVDASTIQY